MSRLTTAPPARAAGEASGEPYRWDALMFIALSSMTEMTSSSLIKILSLLEAADIPVWLDGGWGIDALLEKQSRPHKDADLVMQVSDVPQIRELLEKHGFALNQGSPPNSFVLANETGLEVDVHAIRFDKHGNGVYRMENGLDWIYPAEGFSGQGKIDGHNVHCLSPAIQVLCHAEGYTPIEKDFRDMELLREKFGVELPPQLKPKEG